MAEVPLPTPTDNAVPSTDIRDAVYAGAMLDKVVTSTELTYTDRLGGEHYTVDGIKAEGDKVVEETRQNLIPLSRQYMTLAAAQADIANIPVNSTTYVRSPDGSALADEYMNVAGTLTATGRKMPSQTTVDANTSVITGLDLDRVDVSPASLGTGQYYQISTGTIATTTDTNWAASAPVSVAGYKRLILSGSFLYRAAVAPLLFVDSAGTVISVQSLGIPMSSDNVWSSRSEVQVDIPAAAVSALISTYAEPAVAVYAAAQAFRESGVALSASKTKKRVLNWIPNTYMNIATGVLTSSSDTFAAARVPVAPGDVFTLSCSLKGAPNQIRLIGFFDSNETLIGTFYPGTGSGTVSTITNLTFRVPKNTASMVITAYSVNSSTVLMQASVFDRSATDIQTATDMAGNLAKSSALPYYSGRYWKNTNGALTVIADSQFCAFYPVQVNAGEVYRIKSNLLTGNPSLVSMVVFKGANGELVGTAQPAPGSGAFTAADITVTVPSGAVLMLLTAYSPYIDIVYQGSAVEKIGSSVAGIAASFAQQLSINFSKGYYWNPTSGALTSTTDPNWRAFDAIPVSPGESYRVIATEFSGSIYVVVFKNASGAVVSKSQLGPGGSSIVAVDVPVTVPAGATSMCVTAYTDNVTITKMVNYKADLRKDIIQRDFDTGLRLLSPKGLDGYYWHQNTGVRTLITSDWAYFSVDPIAVSPGEVYRIICAEFSGNPANVYLALFKDSSGAIVGRSYAGPGSGVLQAVDTNVTVPASAATMCITGHSRNLQVIKSGGMISKLPGNSQTQASSPLDYWKGKKIVWLGTSIPAGSGTNSYPYMLAQRLGANIVNQSVGSSPIRGGLDAFVTTDDPYGWTGSSYTRVTRALSHSVDIKQSFIDNYDSKWKALVTGGPASLSDTDKANILSYSYANRLSGNLDSDLFVIDHGINDYLWIQERGGDVASLLTPAVDTRNINTFYGGVNTVIDYILSQNPRARILVIGFYENELRPQVSQIQLKSAQLWEYQIVKLWEKTGWSQQVLTGTDGAGKTITQYWMPDNLHPHSDTTGKANTLLANILEMEIRSVR
ncbi:flagellar biosynthesis, cell-distal portion of basal-body rod [Klebsiella variicola]|nr:flagellar biosynthesis, cell-distal portion of basal-body rod [Klebsiella variicola]